MKRLFLFFFSLCFVNLLWAQAPRFRVLALYENGGHHLAYSKAAKVWLAQLAKDSGFAIDYIQDARLITDSLLKPYLVFLQLDYPPYNWGTNAEQSFHRFIGDPDKAWIGFHHASLLGEFDGFPMWQWYYEFMGRVRFKNYIATFASARVIVEDASHPVMKGLPPHFIINQEEWYTYDRSPRTDVKVLASVDESTYLPVSKITMGDHPVVWSNPAYRARNVYIFMGHSPDLFQNKQYTDLFHNAIFWAARIY